MGNTKGEVIKINRNNQKKKRKMENLMLHNGKIATTTMLKEIGFKGYELSRMVANEEIIREKRGIYRFPGCL